jgi:hypothetical protein
MISKKNIIVSLLLFTISTKLYSEIDVVSYGWELFDRLSDSRITSLAQSTIAYPIASAGISLVNPALSNVHNNKIGLTHQSRISGMVNSEFLGFKKSVRDSHWVSVALLYEGINSIPDTRNALLDWGNDGIFGTLDPGEGNGILDEGERLDANKIDYFSQNQFGLYGAFSRPYKRWELGLGIKLLFHTLDNHYALGTGVNIGAYRSFNKTNLGIVLHNIPSSGVLWDNGNIELTPGSLSIGLHHSLMMEKYGLEINPVCEANFVMTDRTIDSKLLFNTIPLELSGGLETIYKRKIFIRFGFYQSGSLAIGLGMFWKNITVDYAFIIDNSVAGLDNNHLITIGLSSDWIKDKVFN